MNAITIDTINVRCDAPSQQRGDELASRTNVVPCQAAQTVLSHKVLSSICKLHFLLRWYLDNEQVY